jgi:hypothetical protein
MDDDGSTPHPASQILAFFLLSKSRQGHGA